MVIISEEGIKKLEKVLVNYPGKHTENIGKTNITFKIEAVGSDDKTIEVNYS